MHKNANPIDNHFFAMCNLLSVILYGYFKRRNSYYTLKMYEKGKKRDEQPEYQEPRVTAGLHLQNAQVVEKVPDARRTGEARRAAYFGTYASKRFEEQHRRWDFIDNLRAPRNRGALLKSTHTSKAGLFSPG
jgi:hypothetical protein